MNISFNKQAQSGFTLIELIVVIVILGILAATALPKFSGLSGDARIASLQAARGSLNSTSAMLHGRSLIAPTVNQFTVEGGTEVGMTNGYPSSSTQLAAAAGLGSDDYTIDAGDTVLKVTPKNIPSSVAGTCFVTYTESTGAGVAPVVAMAPGLKCD